MQTKNLRIGLCLSGGGLRATFFHLGVVRFLYESGLLGKTVQICSVSGGSILAARLVQRWSHFNAGAEAFEVEAERLFALGRFDLRGRIIRRWLISIILFFPVRLLPRKFWGRTSLLQRYYSKRLLGDATLRTLESTHQQAVPELHILATSLTTGNLCSFDKAGFWVDDGTEVNPIRSGFLEISLAVAASSAFPPLFPPVRLSRDLLDAQDAELPYESEYLTDGGVFDNLGLRKMQRLRQTAVGEVDLILSSDAGAGFDWQLASGFSSVISRTIRTTDILMKRVGDFERTTIDVEHASGVPVIPCSIEQLSRPMKVQP